MALDKQRILNELNSVMNQLQSADCGCMGNLFSTPGYKNCTMNNPRSTCGGCGHGDSHACGHSCGAQQVRQPHTAMKTNTINRHCIGNCNPSQLYADTYNYLNGNLMQPVVQEVYNDLKSITPSNTIPNNPMAGNMGLSQSPDNKNNFVQSATGINNYNNNSEGCMGGTLPPNINNKLYTNQKMDPMAGMGPQIVNMMMGAGTLKSGNTGGQSGQLNAPPPQSPHGNMRFTPVTHGNTIQPQYDTNMDMNVGQRSMNTQQYMNSDNNIVNSMAYVQPMSRGPVQSNVTGLQQMNNVNDNPAAQQMAAAHSHPHGQHTQGIAKFNQMFPGVMQGLGGDLGFDPMSIAIQMNPANQQKVAIDTMHKIMNNKPLNSTVESVSHSGTMQPVIAGAKAAISSIAQSKPDNTISNPTTLTQGAVPKQVLPSEQHLNNTAPNNFSYNAQQPQQVYTAINSQNNKNQQQNSGQPMQYPQTQRQIVDPNTGAVMSPPNLPTVYEGSSEQYNLTSEPVSTYLTDKEQFKEQNFPIDTSTIFPTSTMKQEKYYEYNTLGQPVDMLPAKMYRTPEPLLPQTLAPQPASIKNNHMKYSNVKSTVSKTSLMQKVPVNKISSRSQLQQIYNQYKGSQSYTQQNIKGSGYGNTQSEGNLRVVPGNSVTQAPVDKVGDTVAQKATEKHEIENKVGQAIDHNGDISVSKPTEEVPEKVLPTKQSNNCRNGLQDITYTSYPTSAAWSFHGQNRDIHNFGHHKKFRT